MSSFNNYLAQITIPNGTAQPDRALYSNEDFRDADGITIFCPTTLPETVELHMSWKSNAVITTATDWRLCYRDGAVVTMVAGMAITVPLPFCMALKLMATGNTAGDRVFYFVKGIMAQKF